jgi:Uma2 family endonuclease
LDDLFHGAFRRRVRVQMAITLPEPDGKYTQPEPDLVLLHRDDAELSSRHPGTEDIALVIEVSDTTLRLDRTTKYRLYARAGIQEYWIVDIPQKRVFVCRDPHGDEYHSVRIFSADETISPSAASEFSLRLEQIFA